jgi:hypothetical protein
MEEEVERVIAECINVIFLGLRQGAELKTLLDCLNYVKKLTNNRTYEDLERMCETTTALDLRYNTRYKGSRCVFTAALLLKYYASEAEIKNNYSNIDVRLMEYCEDNIH